MLLLGVVALSWPADMHARKFNDKVLNKPYADMRRIHLGFSIGVHAEDISFSHNGFVTEQGQTWFMEQPGLSPGFCVNGLVDFRLNQWFNVRFSPGMYFGNREIKMVDTSSGESLNQNLKSAYVVLPVDLKYSSLRYHNVRPYLTAGVMPSIDVAKKRSDYLKTRPFDFFVTMGFGCDIYLPYFKFIPELKFCLGLSDILVKDRPDLAEEPLKYGITQSLKRATSKMFVLTFYFE